jgi:hypothetical protein
LLIRLAFDAHVHDVIAANGTRINDNIPAPQSHRVPFFNFEAGQKGRVRDKNQWIEQHRGASW